MKYFFNVALFVVVLILSTSNVYAECGTITQSNPLTCNAGAGDFPGVSCQIQISPGNPCCRALAECPNIPPPQPIPVPTPLFDPDVGVTTEVFDAVNPLGELTGSPYFDDFKTPGGIMTRVLQFAFPIAGLILFVMIVWGGFEILSGAADKKSMDAGRQRVTAAIIGFLLLFSSYWIAQVIEYIFGISIL